MVIKRKILSQIENWLFKEKIIILYGPRQSGKTTLVKQILEKYGSDGLYLNCETEVAQELLSEANPKKILAGFHGKKIVVLDEAQTIENIGRKLKVFFDEYKDVQIIATGSSSFDLANKINEPLTGRSIEFTLWPFSISEIIESSSLLNCKEQEENILRFGLYPQVYTQTDNVSRQTILENLQTNYLYKDILIYEDIKKPALLQKILKSLAFRIGSEISLNSLANELDTSSKTIEKYIDLLEKIFVIKRFFAYSNNKENELKKKFKVYFVDLGIRNSLVQNFNSISQREDIGKIFENFCFIESLKKDLYSYPRVYKNYYFWRNYEQYEIDLIEEYSGKLVGKEFKYSEEVFSKTIQKNFLMNSNNKNVEFQLINKKNYLEYLVD